MREVKPDIVHINNGGYPGASSCNTMVFTLKLSGIKSIIYQINNVAHKQNRFYYRLRDKFINSNVDIFVVASQHLKDNLVNDIEINPLKIKQVLNTISEDLPTIERSKILNELKIDTSDYIICSVGFLFKSKGHQFLLSALNNIRLTNFEIYEHTKLLIIGNGEEEQNLKQYIHENNLSDHVFLLGYQNNAYNFIDSCDIFIFPSTADEDMPLVILTAMSLGKTIVATDLAGISEEIVHGESGMLISANTIYLEKSITEMIVNLYMDRNKANKLGEGARKRYNQLFSNTAYGTSLSFIYKEMFSRFNN